MLRCNTRLVLLLCLLWGYVPVSFTYKIVIIVLTTPWGANRRSLIRNGWHHRDSGTLADISHLRFVVSRNDANYNSTVFQGEMKTMGDFLICDAPTGFQNIIHKVSCGVKYANTIPFEYFFKTDDDSTVCVGEVLHELTSRGGEIEATKDLYFGRHLKVRRKTAPEKPLHMYSGLYKDPPHFGGHGYGVSFHLFKYLHWILSTYDVKHHLHEDTNFALWLLSLERTEMNLNSMGRFIRNNHQLFVDDKICKQYMEQRNSLNISGEMGQNEARCYDAKKPMAVVPSTCFHCEQCVPRRQDIAISPEDHFAPIAVERDIWRRRDSQTLLYILATSCDENEKRRTLRERIAAQEIAKGWEMKYKFIVTVTDLSGPCRTQLEEEIRAQDDVTLVETRVVDGSPALAALKISMGSALRSTDFDFLFLSLEEKVRVPEPSLVVKMLHTHAHVNGTKPAQIYGGGRFVEGSLLEKEFDRVLRVDRAPHHFRDGILLSRSLAEYLQYALSGAYGVQLSFSHSLSLSVAELEMMVGVWLVAFQTQYLSLNQ